MRETKKPSFRQFIEITACIVTIVGGCVATWGVFFNSGAKKNEISKSDSSFINISSKPLAPINNNFNEVEKNRSVNRNINSLRDKKTNILPDQNKNHPNFSQNQSVKNFSFYINPSMTNKNGISILIIDENGMVSNTVSSDIAIIYSKYNTPATVGLIKNSFIKTREFQQLYEGGSEVIEKLQLDRFTSYLGIGKIKYTFTKGTLVDGTIICNASLSMNIISAKNKSLIQSFEITDANGNGVSDSQAKDAAFQNLLNLYSTYHSSL